MKRVSNERVTVALRSAVSLKLFAILIGVASVQLLVAVAASHPNSAPSVSILLPDEVPSETVQIAYHLIGPFGGYKYYTDPKAGLHQYEIEASEGGRAATEIRLIIYATGCEFQTVILPIEQHSSRLRHEFKCKTAQKARLSGRIAPYDLVRDKNAQIKIVYDAVWAYRFFGINDGMLTTFCLTTIRPDSNGAFQVDLPYFQEDTSSLATESMSSFHLTLEDSETEMSLRTLLYRWLKNTSL
jgi:hypothetical protein